MLSFLITDLQVEFGWQARLGKNGQAEQDAPQRIVSHPSVAVSVRVYCCSYEIAHWWLDAVPPHETQRRAVEMGVSCLGFARAATYEQLVSGFADAGPAGVPIDVQQASPCVSPQALESAQRRDVLGR
jgi:hypothetical protein